MNTPLCDFLDRYAASHTLRLHMPGHKGQGDSSDITEIAGMDSLYDGTGIIAQSEENAGTLFGAHTLYSAEGSSLCIRAMLYLLCCHAGRPARVLAGRNAHKAFLTAAALLDIDVKWLYPTQAPTYLACPVDPDGLEAAINDGETPDAVYLTSPDYLGNTVNIAALAEVCHRHGVLLLVDNAHGAYLKFLPHSRHPMDAGADLCCDSAHKTLPVLTGGAYLHLSPRLPDRLHQQAKEAMALFGSTSPSFLILRSLDAVNRTLSEEYPARLKEFIRVLDEGKNALRHHGFILTGDEPLKVSIVSKPYGYTGEQMADYLRKNRIEPEFADPDHLVLMLTPENGAHSVQRLVQVLTTLPRRTPLTDTPPCPVPGQQVMTPRQALFAPSQTLPATQCVGRILAAATVGCPPAVPIVVSGERITTQAVEAFSYYRIANCRVILE
ncbi:MAG: aminotransferase class I/II-fold pyridoxal phosphate-dependent enzyme [Ruminococcaceae bacterium]|nr:aminotransferase class I/II-fold pyridoxal phosphate-dependent enzyme [Oscillospiraceae bacterium]